MTSPIDVQTVPRMRNRLLEAPWKAYWGLRLARRGDGVALCKYGVMCDL